jgi:hypothetical protein
LKNVLDLPPLHSEVVRGLIEVVEEEAAEVSQQILIDHVIAQGRTLQLSQFEIQSESRGRGILIIRIIVTHIMGVSL